MHAMLILCAVLLFGLGIPEAAQPSSVTTAAPVITSLSPASGAPGTLVTINGSNLIGIVTIAFSPSRPAPIYGSTGDGTGVQTEVPDGAVSGPVRIETAAGTVTSPERFEVISAAPIVESFSPSSGLAGTWVHFSGINFEDVTSVQFNGKDAQFTEEPWVFGGLSARVPSGATTGPITITTERGSFTTTVAFTVLKLDAPVISEFSPRSGPPNTRITIRGTNILNVQSVTINGVAAEFGQMIADWLFVTVPAKATTGPLTVVTEYGSATTAEPFEVTQAQPPAITGVSPQSARPHSSVTITGTGLDFVGAVTFSGVAASYTVMGSTIVIARVPYAPSGPIRILCDAGVALSPEPFTVIGGPEPPVLVSFTPLKAVPGTLITAQATNFGWIGSVSFNGTRAQFWVDGSQIDAVVPPLATSGPVILETAYGPASSAQLLEIYNSGQLGLASRPLRDPIVLGDRVTFAVNVTNVSTATLTGIIVTNTFARGDPAGALTWENDTPRANIAPLEDVEIIGAIPSQGSVVSMDGAVVHDLGSLEPGQSANLTIEVEPHLPDIVCLLSVANVSEGDRLPVYSGFLASMLVLGSVQLQVREAAFSEIEILWPVTEPPLVLQSADSPLGAANWTDVPEPVTVAERCSVRLPVLPSHSRFFRLVKGSQ